MSPHPNPLPEERETLLDERGWGPWGYRGLMVGWRGYPAQREHLLGAVRDGPPDRHRGGGGRRRRVADVEDAVRGLDDEVVHQRAVSAERLGADAGRAVDAVVLGDFGDVLLAGLDEQLLAEVADHLVGAHLPVLKVTVLLGHSGVGKSTLVNRLVPEADRATGAVTDIGRGRHTSTQSVALPLSLGGWVIDTPGIRSFGLAHIEPDDVMLAFSDLAEAIKDCPRGCGHLGPPADPECALDSLTGPAAGRVAAARRLLVALHETAATDPTRLLRLR